MLIKKDIFHRNLRRATPLGNLYETLKNVINKAFCAALKTESLFSLVQKKQLKKSYLRWAERMS